MSTVSREQMSAFCSLVERGRALLEPPSIRFRSFVETAKRLLLERIPRQLAESKERLDRIGRWLIDPAHDLLALAGLTYVENSYTRLLAWALRPSTDPETALQRQRLWLRALGISEAQSLTEAVEPQLQVFTGEGIPDMVLRYPTFVLIVEAKTGTGEHAAPGGEQQTFAYPAAVRRKLGLGDDFAVRMILLSPQGVPPANEEATATTFVTFALCFASALEPAAFPEDVRNLLRLWLSHLLQHAAPAGIDHRQFFRELDAMTTPDDPRRNAFILRNLKAINSVLGHLQTSESDE